MATVHTPSALVSARHESDARARLRTLHRARPCPPHCSEPVATSDARERSASGDANTPCLEGDAAVAAAATSCTSAAGAVARGYVTRRARRGSRRAHAAIPSAAARLKPPQLSVTAVLRPPAARLSGSAVSRHADKLAFFCAADGVAATTARWRAGGRCRRAFRRRGLAATAPPPLESTRAPTSEPPRAARGRTPRHCRVASAAPSSDSGGARNTIAGSMEQRDTRR